LFSDSKGGRALLVELVAALLLGLGAHVLLLCILDFPLVGTATDAATTRSWWLVLALF